MRDLIDRHARDMMLDLNGERRGVPPVIPAVLDGGPASQEHAGAGTARGMALGRAAEAVDGLPGRVGWGSDREGADEAHRASDAPGEIATGSSLLRPENWRALNTVWRLQRETVVLIYDWLEREMDAAGPLPLASPEPWAMPDDEYHRYLDVRAPWLKRQDWIEINEGLSLDEIGSDAGFPRPRLVPAPQSIEENRP